MYRSTYPPGQGEGIQFDLASLLWSTGMKKGWEKKDVDDLRVGEHSEGLEKED